jgi:hypothetical protein
MKQLTKVAIIVTCLSLPVLHFSSMSLVLVADSKDLHCVTQWQLPLLGTLGPRASEWWDGIIVLSVIIPPMLWIIVVARKLIFGKWRSAMRPGFN